jgi:hypothetical protein
LHEPAERRVAPSQLRDKYWIANPDCWRGCRTGAAGSRCADWSLGAALAVSGTAQGISFGPHQGTDQRGQQLAQHVGVAGGESFGQHGGQVDIVGTGYRVDSFARVTFDGSLEESRDDLQSLGYDKPVPMLSRIGI